MSQPPKPSSRGAVTGTLLLRAFSDSCLKAFRSASHRDTPPARDGTGRTIDWFYRAGTGKLLVSRASLALSWLRHSFRPLSALSPCGGGIARLRRPFFKATRSGSLDYVALGAAERRPTRSG